MYLLALIPIIVALFLLMVLLYALYMLYTRRDNIKLTLDLKNKDTLDTYGVKLQPSENYEWIVAHIKNKREPGQTNLNSESKIKIGPAKKDGAAGGPKQDTEQGLLGGLGDVDLE